MRPPKQFFVYIMTNGPKSAVLYTGITGHLVHRVWQHKHTWRGWRLARKLLIAVFALLHDGVVFDEEKFAAV